MENSEITKKNKETIEELLNSVQSMTSEEYIEVLNSMARFHDYSYSNQIILHSKGASQVAGFRAWENTYDRKVQKGAKAIWILAPSKYLVSAESFKGDVEKAQIIEKKGKKFVVLVGYRSVPVFDISDTEGEEIKKNMTTYSNLSTELVTNVAKKMGYSVGFEALEVAVGGYISNKKIVLNSNLPSEENVATLIHELSHGELGHTDSTNLLPRNVKEQQAETVTYILCKIFGIDRKSEFYLKAWGLDEGIRESFKEIDLAVKKITEKIEESIKKI